MVDVFVFFELVLGCRPPGQALTGTRAALGDLASPPLFAFAYSIL